ncbi:hypothetical protein GP475_01630 [Corynebacterium poyangense]|uniref:Uncharacterized protein n=1 Tax=Corynebacterium poyangense TaxID=2684405 RepID=A0A7H0SLP6_9CORY|nr:Ltp family lipoprotein [Corynebacterium poyangense]MBZ8177577.1 hypothetical protein [Corynebacterium poyangense]QNQ89471.1 hypothetical protein GP475_01630 [Corynebacterium poyangense]
MTHPGQVSDGYPEQNPQAPAVGTRVEPPAKKPFYKRWWFIAIVAVVVLGTFANLVGNNSSQQGSTTALATRASEAMNSGEAEGTNVNPESQSHGEDVPKEYTNALRKAKTYVEMMHMSKAGVYRQLTSEAGESFSLEAAQYAVDNLDADYNKAALEKAKTYQDQMSMSRDRIYEQLTSEFGEKFTPEEAQYAIDNLPQ